MDLMNIPRPLGIEKFKHSDGNLYTLMEVIHIKKKIKQIICNARKNSIEEINLNNLLDYTILFELYHYNNLEQPDNLIHFFNYILELYSSSEKDLPPIYLTKKEFNNLNCVKYVKCDNFFQNTNIEKCEKCPICIKNFTNSSKVIVLNCKHVFHKTCLSKWLLKKSNKCPMCKQVVY